LEAGMIKLLVKFGDESREVELRETDISIGRAADNVLPLADKKSSRKHARIERAGDEYRVHDLGSGNGTKVNGKDVNTHVLAKGDEISIGLTTIYVLATDTPPKAASAPALASPGQLALTVPASAGIAPAAPRFEEKPAENMGEARRKQTRRAVSRQSSNWVGTLISAVVLAGIVGVGYHFYVTHEKESQARRDARLEVERQGSAKVREAEAEFNKFSVRAKADPVEDSTIAEATALSQTYGALYPAFDTLVSQLKQRRSEQIGRDDFATVDARVQGALRDRRFGDALEALKDMKAGTEPQMSGGLVTKVCDSINVEFKSIDDYGRRLSDEKKFGMAADHYKLQAPKFKGTEHYKYLLYKPENLELLRKAEADAALAKGSRPAEAPKPAEPEKPAETALAKADAAPPAAPAPKEPAAMPAPAMPAPAMPKEMPKPPPAMPKETPKPPAPTAKPPAMPKEPEKKEEPGEKGPFKKPDVLCDCKKIVKGVFCVKCDRLLSPEDMRNGVCKRCEEKPKKIDMCVKRYFMVDGDPSSKSEKPIIKEGKLYDFPYEDKARITYLCETCGETGDSQYEVKHKPDCASKTTIKVCSKSGTPPHGGEKK
jgi:hypothetical protein